MTTTAAPGALCWAEDGSVACRDHSPYPGSDSWTQGHWAPMTAADRAALARETGRPACCHCCDAIARRRAEAGSCS